jgi:hypothetical protein
MLEKTMNQKKVTLNPEQQVYVIPCGEGYSCWGFQNCWDQVVAMVEMLEGHDGRAKIEVKREKLFGSIDLYEISEELTNRYANSPLSKETWFDPQTPLGVRKTLECARKSDLRVRIWLGDESGLSWLEENDTIGKVGRSMGPLRIPLLVPEGEAGGGGILTASVIRIRNERTRTDLYVHPKFRIPDLRVEELSPSLNGLTHVLRNGTDEHSRHRSYAEACGFIAWLAGAEYCHQEGEVA